MKALAPLLSLMLTAPAAAAPLLPLESNRGVGVYVDLSRLDPSGDVSGLTSHTIFNVSGGTPQHAIATHQYDCTQGRHRLVSLDVADAQGRRIATARPEEIDPTWRPVMTSGLGARMMRLACGREQPNRSAIVEVAPERLLDIAREQMKSRD